MKLSQLLTRLEKTEQFKIFKKQNPDAFLCAAFIILRAKGGLVENEYSLDYKTKEQIFTFKIPTIGEIIMQNDELIEGKPLEEINPKILTDIEELNPIVERALLRNSIKSKLEEIIAVLQTIEGKTIWNLTCMCEGLVIINIHVDALSGDLTKFEKRNLLDFIKK